MLDLPKKSDSSKNDVHQSVWLSSMGVALEYYDFIIYGLLVPFMMPLFFDETNSMAILLKGFSVFALGYIARPLGGILFGQLADRKGRKIAFTSAMLVMACATALIGLLPTFNNIGVLSTWLLILCRLAQGISYGAEMPGAITLISETLIKTNQTKIHHSKQGLYCGIVMSSATLGALMATAMISLLMCALTKENFSTFGWRIPFIFGGSLAFISCYLRQSLNETNDFKEISNQQRNKHIWQPLTKLMRNHFTNILLGIGITLYPAALVITNIYFATFFTKYYLVVSGTVYNGMTIGLMCSVILVPIIGWLSGHMGRLTIYISGGILFIASGLSFTDSLFDRTTVGLIQFLIIWQIFNAASMSIVMPWLSELFPTSVRVSGVSLCYNLAFVIGAFLPNLYTYLGVDTIESLMRVMTFIAIGGMVCAILIARLFYNKNIHDHT